MKRRYRLRIVICLTLSILAFAQGCKQVSPEPSVPNRQTIDDTQTIPETDSGSGTEWSEYTLKPIERSTDGLLELFGGDLSYHKQNGHWYHVPTGLQYKLEPYQLSYLAGLTVSNNLEMEAARLKAFFPAAELPSGRQEDVFRQCDHIADQLHIDRTHAEYYVLDAKALSATYMGLLYNSPSKTVRYIRENGTVPDAMLPELMGLEDEDAACLAVYRTDRIADLDVPFVSSSRSMDCYIIFHPEIGVVYLNCPNEYEVLSQKSGTICSEKTAVQIFPAVLLKDGLPFDYIDIQGYHLSYTLSSIVNDQEEELQLLRPCWVCDLALSASVDDSLLWGVPIPKEKDLEYTDLFYICMDAFTADPDYYWEAYPLP